MKVRFSQPAISTSYLVWQIQRCTGLRRSFPEVERPVTGQLKPPGVYNLLTPKGPTTGSKLMQGKSRHYGNSKCQGYFREKISLSLGKQLHIILIMLKTLCKN